MSHDWKAAQEERLRFSAECWNEGIRHPEEVDRRIDKWTATETDGVAGHARNLIERRLAARLADEFIEYEIESVEASLNHVEVAIGTLGEVRANYPEPSWRVEGLLPEGGALLLVAQRKTGKTTTSLNLVGSMTSGEPFLGRFPTTPVDGRVAWLNYEVGPAQAARWATEHGIDDDRLVIVNLRGQPNPLASTSGRDWLRGRLRAYGVRAAIIDPFQHAFTGGTRSSGDPNANTLEWLTTINQWREGLIGELVIVHHAGWDPTRSRGASAIEDWADTIANIENKGGTRYFRAIGRDVDVEEDRLAFDPATRRLTLTGTGGQRAEQHEQRAGQLDEAVLADVATAPAISISERERRLRNAGTGLQRGEVGRALSRLVADGRIIEETGPRGAKYHRIALTHPDLSRPVPTYPDGTCPTYPDPPYRGREVEQVRTGPAPEQVNPPAERSVTHHNGATA